MLAINLPAITDTSLRSRRAWISAAAQTILIIDADLQDPPELLPAMFETMRRQDADVVYGVRRSRAGETAFKRATAHGFLPLAFARDGDRNPARHGRFPADEPASTRRLLAMPEQARFIRGMVAWIGFRQVPFAYDRERALRRRDQISAPQDAAFRASMR